MKSTSTSLRVLVVDPDRAGLDRARSALAQPQIGTFEVDTCASYEEARPRLLADRYDAYLVDYALGGEDVGAALVRETAVLGRVNPVILWAARDDVVSDREAYGAGAAGLLSKDVDALTLRRAIRYAVNLSRELERARAQLRWLRAIYERGSELTCVIGADGRFQEVNAAWERALGWPRTALVGTPLHQLVHPDDVERTAAWAREPGIEPSGERFRNRYRAQDGGYRWLSWSPLGLLPGETSRFGTARDITDLVIAETRLRASEARQRSVVDASPDPIVTVDPDGRVLEWNPASSQLFGHAATEAVGRLLRDLAVPARHRGTHQAGLDASRGAWPGIVMRNRPTVAARKDGTEFPIELTVVRLDEGGAFTAFVRDTSARAAAAALDSRMRVLVEGASDLIAELDAEGTITYVNPVAEPMLGYHPDGLIGRPALEFIHPQDVMPVAEVLAAALGQPESTHTVSFSLRTASGDWRPVEARGRAVLIGGVPTVVVTARDMSDRLLLEEQLRQSQRLEAIGRLAGGVAHDFNNMLGVILGMSDLLLEDIPESSSWHADVSEIRSAARRASALTRQLLAFGRRQVIQPEVVQLNGVLSSLETMLARVIGEDVEVVTRPAPDLGTVRVDPGQIEQVILNLVINARDAMPGGGRLVLGTSNVEVGSEYVERRPEITPGRYVMLAVSDTGTGMSPEVMARIFEPFFTTKPPGKGTGLGLAMVYGTIRQFGGFIWCYSEPGRGTTFKIHLPRVDEPAPSPPGLPGTPVPADRAEAGTVLLVEDERMIRQFVETALTRLGYTVIPAANVEEAEALFANAKGRIEVLLTDVVLRGGTGKELADRITALRPGLPVVFMSGYTEEGVIQQGAVSAGALFLQKPFTPAQLGDVLRRALERR